MTKTIEIKLPLEKSQLYETSKSFGDHANILNMIQETRKSVLNLTEIEKFERARIHLEQALQYKNPRVDIFNQQLPSLFKICYMVQTNVIWGSCMRFLSFVYMYLIAFSNTDLNWVYIQLSAILLAVFWIDIVMEVYHTSFDKFRIFSRFSTVTYLKLGVLLLLIVQMIFNTFQFEISQRPFNPLRVLRATLPILYISQIQRSFEALLSASQHLLVFMVFYSIIIITFAIGGSIIIKIPAGLQYDAYTQNYQNLEHMLFITYVNSSYDAYPDNQLLAIQQSEWYYLFIIAFVILNMFLYTSIPGSILFDTYINYRGKFMLIDEIKMQHSLILAFVSLGQINYEIDIRKVIDFLLYWYDYRTRYLDTISQVVLKLNDDGNCSIHVLEFMQLGRILQENSSLRPPILKDSNTWIGFRKWILEKTKLKKTVKSFTFQVIVGIFIIAGCINSYICIFSSNQSAYIVNNFLSYVFILEIIIKVVGHGPQNFYNKKWNMLDLLLVITSFIFSFFDLNSNYSAMFKICRIFRSISLLNYIKFQNGEINESIFGKINKLFGTIIVILPLVMRFLPLFFIVYYILGIIGMEIFYDAAQMDPTSYNTVYDDFSNFKAFIYTQFYFMQILTEAGWSAVAFDYAKRLQPYFFIVMLFFVFCHMVIVLVLATLLKGIVWSVFSTVSSQFEERQKAKRDKKQLKQKLSNAVSTLTNLKQTLSKEVVFIYDTVLKRQCYEANANCEIMKQLVNQKVKNELFAQKMIRSVNTKLHKHFQSNKIMIEKEELKRSFPEGSQNNFLFTIVQKFKNSGIDKPLEEIQEIEQEDIQIYLKRLSQKFKLKTSKINFQIDISQMAIKHLKQKIIAPFSLPASKPTYSQKGVSSMRQLKINNDQFTNKKTLEFHINTLHMLLNMRTSRRGQKRVVIDSLIKSEIIDKSEGYKLLIRKAENRKFIIDQDCTVRKMYLSGTNKNLIDKFEAEYFGDIYGSAFKEVNKFTIEPLIRLQANISSAIKKLMRYPQINSAQFFKILSKIQNQISNSLLKKGSLCKFVFQLNSIKQVWFSIGYNNLNECKLSFLKHGLWIYHDQLSEHQIYYSKDMFKTGNSLAKVEIDQKAQIMQKLFQAFQTLAFSLSQREYFFDSNPVYHVYDCYLNYLDVSKMQRLAKKQFQISKIMIVMLTKQDERTDSKLQYPITDIKIDKPLNSTTFKLDQTQTQTYKKLSKLCSLNNSEITANQGMPFAYVLNFLCEINDILKLYAPNFTHQIEKVLNTELFAESNNCGSDYILNC